MKKILQMSMVATYLFFVGGMTAVLFPTTAVAACSNDVNVLGFPTWFHGLECTPATANGAETVDLGGDINKIWIVVMNILQWLIVATAYVAAYFIIWSGFKYMLGAGEPDKIKEAKETLTNAVIGLVIALIAVAIVRTIQAAVVGSLV